MKTLTLIRHAKSSWEGNFKDFDRPLNDRGLRDLQKMVEKAIEFKLETDLVLSSPAKRALTTANAFVVGMYIQSENFVLNQNLYDFSGEYLVRTIKSVNDSVNSLMVFGHNHAITYFVNAFGNQYIDNVPTCGLVTIEFDIDSWADLKKGNTINILFPKELD